MQENISIFITGLLKLSGVITYIFVFLPSTVNMVKSILEEIILDTLELALERVALMRRWRRTC
jgi:hypothetical protein